MNTKKFLSTIFIMTLFLVSVGETNAAPVDPPLESVTATALVDRLISQGFISAPMQARAYALAHMVRFVQEVPRKNNAPRNAERVSVQVSQYIQYAGKPYRSDETIRGLILITQNTSEAPIELEAKRGCQVVYAIFEPKGTTPLYTSAQKEVCTANQQVTYVLPANGVRIFEIEHTPAEYRLSPGTYRFVLTYPGYGTGERSIAVQDPGMSV